MRRAWPPPAVPRIAIASTIAILLIATALKLHFSHAGPDALAWILGPTVGAVELATGIGFQSEGGVGYLARSHMFAVTKSCAGVNFLVVAFTMLGVGCVWGARSPLQALRAILLSAVVALACTVVANAVRITVAMPLAHGESSVLGFTGEELHRLVGVTVYFGALCLLYALFFLRGRSPSAGVKARAVCWLPPLGFYLGVTLVVPLLNSWLRGRPLPWNEHTAVLLTVPAVILLVFALCEGGLSATRSALRRG